jgi:spermidine synthase
MLLHPDPRRVLVIGFGIGITASTAARFTTGSLDCIEICPAVAQAADYFSRYNDNVLYDPRVSLIKGDGRNYLLLTRDKYDVISCDPTHPLLGCGTLYTREFFELCRRRLNPGGVVCQYLPLHKISLSDFEAILRTFHDVFPNASLWIGFSHAVMAGRVEPGSIDYASLARQFARPAVRSTLAQVNLGTPAELLGCLILDKVAVGRFVLGSRINTDRHPVVEFSGPRSLSRPTWSENMSALLNFRSDPALAITNIPPETLATVRMIQGAKSFLYRGMAKQELGLFKEAFDEYSAGLQLNPQDVELRMMIDRVLR